jgi:hypothetical protein
VTDSTNPHGTIQIGGEIVSLSPTSLPVVYFDSAPSFSHLSGIIGVTLTVTGNVPVVDGNVAACASVVAHLKCNIHEAMALRAALDGALLLAQPVENPGGKAN